MQPVTIIGGGLVGTLLSLYLARRGHEVEVFEKHVDLRREDVARGTSINLTLCPRGLRALDRVGVGGEVRRIGVPALGRMIHVGDGPPQWQPYGNERESLLSVSRNELNRVLLDRAEEEDAITLRFGRRCLGLDLHTLELTFEDGAGRPARHTAAVVIGADGAFSTVRLALQRRYGFNYCQEYSALGYKQLDVPASREGWTAHREALHIWPRGRHMLLAIPNRDGSFVATLLMPLHGPASHEVISTAGQLRATFASLFPDAVGKIADLEQRYLSQRAFPMVTIRCSPWSFEDRVVLIGDAAHAVFPSYGQGANAGFEDCATLDDCLERTGGDWGEAFGAFEERRREDVNAIADLSKQHLIDLCAALGSPERTLRDSLERKLNRMYRRQYLPLYSMVAFTDMPYAEAVRIDRDRQPLLERLTTVVGDRDDLDDPDVERLIDRTMQTAGVLSAKGRI